MPSRQWQAIVGQYSLLLFNNEADRLPALSELADQASPTSGDTLAGLWSTTFLSDLTWRVRALKAGSRRSADNCRGPSWSWASIDSTVSYCDELWTDITGPRGARTTPFGEVTLGEVAVEGYLRPVRLEYVRTRPWLSHDVGEESAHDPLRYEIAFGGGLELLFFADYVLSEEGPHYVADPAVLHLLLIYPDIRLVLLALPKEAEALGNQRPLRVLTMVV